MSIIADFVSIDFQHHDVAGAAPPTTGKTRTEAHQSTQLNATDEELILQELAAKQKELELSQILQKEQKLKHKQLFKEIEKEQINRYVFIQSDKYYFLNLKSLPLIFH